MSKQLTAVELGLQSATPLHALGELYIDDDGNHYRYMQADGAVVANVLYSYRPVTWQIEEYIKLATDPATAEVMGACASTIAITDNYYAWVFVGPGQVTLTTAGSVAADAIIYGVNGNGTVDDAAVALLLDGLTCPAAITGATTGTFYALRPLMALDLA
jgi:hypothetical protein